MNRIGRGVRLFIYYGLLRWLPNDNVPGGFIFDKLRYYCCRGLFRHCGHPVNIRHFAHFGKGSRLSIGNHSDLGTNCFIIKDVSIGNNVSMGFDVFITSLNREFSRTDVLALEDGERPAAPVTIADDIIILARSTILAGVTIGSHSVIAGSSVVSKDVPEWCIVAGNPARVVKWRKEPEPGAYDPSTMTPLSEKLAKNWARKHPEPSSGAVRESAFRVSASSSRETADSGRL